jgi:uncharacterized protein (TIGR02453 family)
VQPHFAGFPTAGIDFLKSLKRNNRREWFLPRKEIFEQNVKAPMHVLVDHLNAAFARFAPEHVMEPNKAVYRFYRDTRFSEDKSPYKDRIAATFQRRGIGRHEGAGYYFHVSPKEVAVGGGVYLAPPESLQLMRARIAAEPREFRRLITAAPLKKLFGEMQGDQLARVPKGYPADHPAADLLRYKQFLFFDELPASLAVTPDLADELVRRFRAMAKFIDFLNEPLLASRKSAQRDAALLGL